MSEADDAPGSPDSDVAAGGRAFAWPFRAATGWGTGTERAVSALETAEDRMRAARWASQAVNMGNVRIPWGFVKQG
jgi:hypothetical protein